MRYLRGTWGISRGVYGGYLGGAVHPKRGGGEAGAFRSNARENTFIDVLLLPVRAEACHACKKNPKIHMELDQNYFNPNGTDCDHFEVNRSMMPLLGERNVHARTNAPHCLTRYEPILQL